jgi:hypothetical protein
VHGVSICQIKAILIEMKKLNYFFVNLNMNNNSSLAVRHKLYDFIRVADDKKLQAIYYLLESEIEQTKEWWESKVFISELDERYEALKNGTDKGLTVDELKSSISKLRKKKYG